MHFHVLVTAALLTTPLVFSHPACAQTTPPGDGIIISFPKGGLGFVETLELIRETTGLAPQYRERCVPARIRMSLRKSVVVPKNKVFDFWQRFLGEYGFALVPLGPVGQFLLVEPIGSHRLVSPRIPRVEASELISGSGHGMVTCSFVVENRSAEVAERFLREALETLPGAYVLNNSPKGNLYVAGEASILRLPLRIVWEWERKPKPTPLPELEILRSKWVPAYEVAAGLRHMVGMRASGEETPASIEVASNAVMILGTGEQLRVAREVREIYRRLDAAVEAPAVSREYPLTFVPPYRMKKEIAALSRSPKMGFVGVQTNVRKWSIEVTALPGTMPLITDFIRGRDR